MLTALNFLAFFSFAVRVVVAESAALFARQLTPGFNPNDVPASCVALCKPYMQAVGASCPSGMLSCLCTDTVASDVDCCISCVVNANIPDFTAAQGDQIINDVVNSCKQAGFPVSISGSCATISSSSAAGVPPSTPSTVTTPVGGASSTKARSSTKAESSTKAGSTGTATSASAATSVTSTTLATSKTLATSATSTTSASSATSATSATSTSSTTSTASATSATLAASSATSPAGNNITSSQNTSSAREHSLSMVRTVFAVVIAGLALL